MSIVNGMPIFNNAIGNNLDLQDVKLFLSKIVIWTSTETVILNKSLIFVLLYNIIHFVFTKDNRVVECRNILNVHGSTINVYQSTQVNVKIFPQMFVHLDKIVI